MGIKSRLRTLALAVAVVGVSTAEAATYTLFSDPLVIGSRTPFDGVFLIDNPRGEAFSAGVSGAVTLTADGTTGLMWAYDRAIQGTVNGTEFYSTSTTCSWGNCATSHTRSAWLTASDISLALHVSGIASSRPLGLLNPEATYAVQLSLPDWVTFRSATILTTPGPIAGAGLPVLVALGGLMWMRRRKAAGPVAA